MNLSNDTSIRRAQEEVAKFLEKQGRDWTQIDNRFYLFTHMAEEIGELARHIITAEFNLGLDRAEGEPVPRERIVSLIEDDVGDIMYHVLKLAVSYDIDAAEAFRGAMSNIRGRYGREWTRNASPIV